MPPVNQQGSRAGLITSLIISVILLMVAVIMAITTNTSLTKKTGDYDSLVKTYEKVVPKNQVSAEDGDVAVIESARDRINASDNPVIVGLAVKEIEQLTRDITGAPAKMYADADSLAVKTVERALAVLKNPAADLLPVAGPTTAPAGAATASMPDGKSLVIVIDALEKQLHETAKTDAMKADQLKALDASLKKHVEDCQIAELNTKVAAANKRADDAEAAKTAVAAQYTTKQTDADASNKTTVDATGKQVIEMQTAVAQAKQETAKIAAENNSLKGQLAKYRLNVKDAAVRPADGSIIRVPSANTCYISLGSGDHLPAGTTFEVYEKNEGIPGLGNDPLGPTGMPVGKASIEVVKVGQNSSECRVVHLQPGVTLSEGDLIGNLVYNKNTTFNFVVFGNFDTDGNGVWTAQEADVVKSLVTRWGGKVQDKIGVNTDFVILGQEPEVPAVTKENADDAIFIDKVAKANAALKAYQEVINQAATLHIPIMNQNRFMYYIGYFDQMKR